MLGLVERARHALYASGGAREAGFDPNLDITL